LIRSSRSLITPPIGMNLFVLRVVADDLPLRTIIRGILPFILADIVRLAILLAIPALSLWLPATMR
jgi:TRAP-type C4-dicarboxylate transport system permease large subunit